MKACPPVPYNASGINEYNKIKAVIKNLGWKILSCICVYLLTKASCTDLKK